MKIDPYKHEETYKKWRSEIGNVIPGLSIQNSNIILQFIDDMEHGLNVSSTSVKGSRSYIRLNTLRSKMYFFGIKFKERYDLEDITKVNEIQLHKLFSEMRKGVLKRIDGKTYQSVTDYTKAFKAFWHWYQKTNRKKGIEIEDITVDLDTSKEKPKWVYLDEDQVKELCNKAKYEYRVLIMFLFDSGIRAPTELMNIKVSDLRDDCKELHIRDEVSKTFGRRIKLMICPPLLKEYLQIKKLKSDSYLFPICPKVVNRYLKRLALNVFGDVESQAGQKYSELTMYDLRHISCCYWLPRYKSESALKYRFGWKKSEKIHYYSELLGMKDTISEDDMLMDVTKTEIERRLDKTEREKDILNEEVNDLRNQMKLILSYVKRVNMNVEYIFDGKND